MNASSATASIFRSASDASTEASRASFPFSPFEVTARCAPSLANAHRSIAISALACARNTAWHSFGGRRSSHRAAMLPALSASSHRPSLTEACARVAAASAACRARDGDMTSASNAFMALSLARAMAICFARARLVSISLTRVEDNRVAPGGGFVVSDLASSASTPESSAETNSSAAASSACFMASTNPASRRAAAAAACAALEVTAADTSPAYGR
mmetsp:Transcript_6624/g.24974  ORF Transcript_6624/g.24974 Transcript_6624/m.24974 type:complete len:216 (-) Transcript_6624:1501-2148(-)